VSEKLHAHVCKQRGREGAGHAQLELLSLRMRLLPTCSSEKVCMHKTAYYHSTLVCGNQSHTAGVGREMVEQRK
jgi:hypothetical protein